MGRDPDTYENPNEFKPERWFQGENADRAIGTFDEYQFPVFQGGFRICAGKDLALYETKAFLVWLLSNYKITYKPAVPDENVAEGNMILRFRGPINVILEKREQS